MRKGLCESTIHSEAKKTIVDPLGAVNNGFDSPVLRSCGPSIEILPLSGENFNKGRSFA